MSTNRWSWDVSGFNTLKSPSPAPETTHTPPEAAALPPLLRRYSISSPSAPPPNYSSELDNSVLDAKVQKLKENVKLVRDDYIELRQEACDLQEYSNAKLDRVTRYLGVLAAKTRKLDQAALEAEARISPLIYEKKKLFNDLLTAKGNIKVFCRARPLFEDEGPSVVEFPDYSTIRVYGDDNLSNPKKDFEFESVYGPHVAQADLFNGVQPFVQSAFDGYNVSILAYGQTGSGKTFTMEGSRNDRGLYARCFEELFDLSNSEATSTSQYNFSVSVFDMYNEQVRDLLSEYGSGHGKIRMGSSDSFVDLAQEFVQNPMDFSKILKVALQNRGSNESMFNVSHLIVTIHIYFSNSVTDEKLYSKLTLVDLAGSETTTIEDDFGPRATDMLHVMKSLSALGDVLHALITKKEEVPYGNSMLTNLLADVLGGNSKSLMIVNVIPNESNISQTLSSLNFSARASNAALSLGNRDTIVKFKDIANVERRKLLEREKEINDLKQEVLGLRLAIKHANDQCVLLFNEVQKAWKVSFALQSDLKLENILLMEKLKCEIDQSAQLRNQVAELMQSEQDQNMKAQQRDSTIETLQAKLKGIEKQLNEALSISANGAGSGALVHSNAQGAADNIYSSTVTKRLEDELLKRDALIEKLHEENEKLFERLTEKSASSGSPQVVSQSQRSLGVLVQDTQRKENETRGSQQDVSSLSLATDKNEGALVKSGGYKKTTPAGEYLTSALNDFDPDQYEGLAAVSDGVNKILMLVLAAVIKAGASREHEILAEIRDAVFAFIRKMEPQRVMDTMLVSRVRILYIRSLLARSPELQSIKVPPVERFLEKSSSGHSRSSSRGSSPRRSPVRYESSPRNALVGEQIQGFKVNIKPEKKSKLSSVVLKLRGIDQESWRQHVTGGKLREITEDAKSFSVGNRALAALFVHTPAGELQRQIRNWLAENFDFLSVTDDLSGGTSGQLELLSTAIMDGWMAGLGAAIPPHTDALGQLLSEYAKRVYNSQLQHLKDIAGTLATEVAEDAAQVGKLRSALESVDHKRRKSLQQMRSDEALLTLHDGGSPIRNPSTAAEDARLASLVSLDGILKQVKDIIRQSSVNTLSKSKKRSMLESLDELEDRMPSLLDIDHPCAQRHITDARQAVESVTEEEDQLHSSKLSTDVGSGQEADVVQWNVLQFNTGPTTTPFIVKCGANSSSELVVKADARIQEPKGGEIVRVVPKPTLLENMNLEEMKELFAQLPEALSLLALARTADGTRARYSRLYRTLAMKVPALRDLIGELEKGGALKDTRA